MSKVTIKMFPKEFLQPGTRSIALDNLKQAIAKAEAVKG